MGKSTAPPAKNAKSRRRKVIANDCRNKQISNLMFSDSRRAKKIFSSKIEKNIFFGRKTQTNFDALFFFFLRKDVHILHYCIVERQKCDRAQTKNPPTGGKKKTDNVPKLFALLDLCGRIVNSYLLG